MADKKVDPLARVTVTLLMAPVLMLLLGCPGTLPHAAAEPEELLSVYFSESSGELSEVDRAHLEALVERLQAKPDSTWIISGHAVDADTSEGNLALSELRVQAIRDYLLAREVPPHQLLVRSWGEERPFCGEADPWCRAQNRRVIVFGPIDTSSYPQDAFNRVLEVAAERVPTPQWSKWTERNGATIRRLEVGKNYEVYFDYSAYDYREVLDAFGADLADSVTSAPSTPDLEAEVERARQEAKEAGAPDKGRASIWVQPVLLGDGIEFRPGSGKAQEVEIDLARLGKPLSGVDPQSPADLARAVGALRVADGTWRPIRVEVEVRSEGCAAVALSIWNEHPDKPLDYVQQVLTIGPHVCDQKQPEETLGRRLLRLFGEEPGGEILADAGLQVFEMHLGDELRSVAVLLIRDPTSSEVPFLSWQLPEPLSQYVSHEQKLLLALKNARNAVGGYDFKKVSASLKDAIFSGRRVPTDTSVAGDARQAFDRFAKRKDEPRFYAKLVDPKGHSLFLPLGLLEFGDGKPFGSRAEIVQPLFEEDFETKECVNSWNFVLPEKLDGLDETYLDLKAPVPGKRISKWSGFDRYLHTQPEGQLPEGLLLLAHHADGAVWFREQLGTTSHGQLSRLYPDGSVAILISCALGDLEAGQDRLGWVQRLQDLRIDAVILSPFEVNAKYGARFAVHFADQLRKVKTGDSLATLFKATIDGVEGDEMVKDINASPYEFLIAGNGSLEICPPGGE